MGLSQALICGGALGALLVNSRERHPTADRPLIDYGLAAFLAPAEMAGAQFGVLLNQSLPSLLVLLAMVISHHITMTSILASATGLPREGPHTHTP